MDARKWSAKWRNCEHFRFILLTELNRGAKATEVARNICAVYAIKESTTGKCFFRFKEDRFDVSDTPRPERPSGFDEDRLNTLIYNDHVSVLENWQM